MLKSKRVHFPNYLRYFHYFLLVNGQIISVDCEETTLLKLNENGRVHCLVKNSTIIDIKLAKTVGSCVSEQWQSFDQINLNATLNDIFSIEIHFDNVTWGASGVYFLTLISENSTICKNITVGVSGIALLKIDASKLVNFHFKL